ncbi:MAG: sigma 54-interacting transcriptional regulator [Pirellulales bacterium]
MAESDTAYPARADSSQRDALFAWVLGSHPDVLQIAQHVQRAADAECTVLISGETGTGKEIWARHLYQVGPRAAKPFVPVNCAALTLSLAESQLFGHERGAFTGAVGRSLGVFRAAEGGIVFLDEVGEMPLELQPKLLRVMQQHEVTPVGAAHPTRVDVQVVAATNRDLVKEVDKGRFREDLYYRLNMVELNVPPLRRRVADIPAFIDFFSRQFAAKYRRPLWRPDHDLLRTFCEYGWPGNIRQLSHTIEQAYVLDCVPRLPQADRCREEVTLLPFTDLARLRETAIRQALQATQGHKGQAARLLGVHPNTMTRLLGKLRTYPETTREVPHDRKTD